jgi:hypothetical protein
MTGAHTSPPTRPPTRAAVAFHWLRQHSRPWMLYGLGGVVLALILVLSVVYTSHSNGTQDALDTANAGITAVKSQAAPLAGQVQSVCDQGGVAATALNNAGACTQASKVQSVVEEPGPSGPSGPAGPGPSQDEINAAVNAYFGVHPLPPGQLPPVSEVAGLVAQYLQANPPAAGQNATPGMVSDAVSSYCAANNGCAGPAGATGPGATDAQVQQQVATYCAAHDNCAGPAGTNGTNGSNGAPGPACPSGYAPESAIVTIPTSNPNNPLVSTTQVPGIACVQQ